MSHATSCRQSDCARRARRLSWRQVLLGASLAALAWGAPPATAQDQAGAAQPDLPGHLLNDPADVNFPAFGPGVTTRSRRSADIPAGAAMEVVVPAKGANLYTVGANVVLYKAIHAGEDVVVAFHARTVSASTPDGQGLVGVRLQQNIAPYAGFGDTTVTIGKTWKLYEVTAKADRDIPAGQGVVSLQLAGAAQTLQLGQTFVLSGATSLSRAPAPPTSCKTATPVLMPQLAGQGQALTDIDALNWDVNGPVTSSRIMACGVAGDSALRFVVPAAGKMPYDAVASVPLTGPSAAGDHLIVAFIARTAPGTTSPGTLGLRVQANTPPDYPGFADHTFAIGPTWKLVQLRTVARDDIPAGSGAVALHLAGAAQTLDIGRVYVIRTPAGTP